VTVTDEYLAALLAEVRAIRTLLEPQAQTPQPATVAPDPPAPVAVPEPVVELREPEANQAPAYLRFREGVDKDAALAEIGKALDQMIPDLRTDRQKRNDASRMSRKRS
jgi:hypothetical protein